MTGGASVRRQTTTQTVYVIRHAIAEDRLRWTAPDDKRPLTRAGELQAERLAANLAGSGIQRIFSSPSLRCVQTVEALAYRLGLRVEQAPALQEGTPAETALQFLLRSGAGAVAGCSHGDVMGELVGMLGEERVIEDPRPRFKKASTWVLEAEDGDIRRARYLPPP